MIKSAIQSIAIFCGSRSGVNPSYAHAAKELGTLMAKQSISLVYGGGSIGLMNDAADACLQNGGKVIGVLPTFFNVDVVGRTDISELIFVETMSQRKEKIMELSDAFIALPGGYGTLDELFEALVSSQLSLHCKPVAILNTSGFYDPMITQLRTMQEEGFLYEIHREMLIISLTPQDLLAKIQTFDYNQDMGFLKNVKR